MPGEAPKSSLLPHQYSNVIVHICFKPTFRNAIMRPTGGRTDDGTPILLLKTKSTPNDGYEEQFSSSTEFDPVFVPVLEHKFFENELTLVENLLRNKEIGKSAESKYGGMIFTSQRAVEAFARLVENGMGATSLLYFQFGTSDNSICR